MVTRHKQLLVFNKQSASGMRSGSWSYQQNNTSCESNNTDAHYCTLQLTIIMYQLLFANACNCTWKTKKCSTVKLGSYMVLNTPLFPS